MNNEDQDELYLACKLAGLFFSMNSEDYETYARYIRGMK